MDPKEYPINFPSSKIIKKFDYNKPKRQESIEAPLEQVADPKPVEEAKPEEPASVFVESREEPISDEPILDLDAAVRELEKHFYNPAPEPEPYHASAYVREQVSSERADNEIGNRVDGIVVAYRPETGGGFIRIVKYGRSKSGLWFGPDDIISGDLIGVESRVRCFVGPPNDGHDDLTARQIEILPDPEIKLEPKPETIIYEREVEEERS